MHVRGFREKKDSGLRAVPGSPPAPGRPVSLCKLSFISVSARRPYEEAAEVVLLRLPPRIGPLVLAFPFPLL